MNSVIIHYHEIALKGRNRPQFINQLVRNIKNVTFDLDVPDVRVLPGRVELILGTGTSWDAVRLRIERVFGIANFSHATRADPDIESLARTIDAALGERQVSSFRVSARRSDKRFPLTSPQIEQEIGGRINDTRGWRVNLSQPELTIHIEMLSGEAFFFFDKIPGPGGLPVGVSGQVACLVSGGIDAPVAAYRIMKRGCSAQLIHFHGYPILSHTSIEKARQLAEALLPYQPHLWLHLVPFGEIQQQIMSLVPSRFRVLIYRRLMMLIADRVAHKLGALALITGDAVGQVASQTLKNLAVLEAAASLPVLRPLIAMDKDEIIAEAIRIGTYPISIIPDQELLPGFTPRDPATAAGLREVEEAEKRLPWTEMVTAAVAGASVEEFRFRGVDDRVQKAPPTPSHA
jgi:thiamine biosynthesis protein ThiI